MFEYPVPTEFPSLSPSFKPSSHSSNITCMCIFITSLSYKTTLFLPLSYKIQPSLNNNSPPIMSISNNSTVPPTNVNSNAVGKVMDTTTTTQQIQATKIIYKAHQSDSIVNVNVDNITPFQMIIGLLIILACCIIPLFIGFAICICMHKKTKRRQLEQTKIATESDFREQHEKHDNHSGDTHDGDHRDTSKVGLSATDSLKLQPSSDNYSFTPSGPKLIVIDTNLNRKDVSSEKNPNSKPALGNLGSDNSEAIYEHVEHEYDMNTPGQPQLDYNEQRLQMTNLSTDDNNKMNEILQCVINQPSIKSQTPMVDGRLDLKLKLNKHVESINSDNSEILYENNHRRTFGFGIEDTSNRKDDRVNNGPSPVINIERV